MKKDRPTGQLPRVTQRAPSLRNTGKSPAVPGDPGATSPAEALRLSGVGVDLFEKGQFERARDAFAKAAQIVPSFVGFAANLGGALLAARQPKEALEVLVRAYESGDGTAPLLLNLGIAQGEEGERDR